MSKGTKGGRKGKENVKTMKNIEIIHLYMNIDI
jgi:hypothetical protein